MAKRTRHWVKLWVDWIDSKAHAELSEGAFGLGPLLLLLAVWDGEYESGGWLLNEAGKPMSLDALARITHRTVQRLRGQIEELEWCLTLSRREDGALGFPNFGRWQETKAAKRMRTKRERSSEQGGEQFAHGDGQTGDGTDGRRSSASQNTPVVPKLDEPSPIVAHVLAELRLAVQELDEGNRGPRDTEANRKLVAKATREHRLDEALWTHAIRAQLENVRSDRTKWVYLSLSTICVPKNMARLLDAPAPKPTPPGGGSVLPSFDDYERASAEERDATR